MAKHTFIIDGTEYRRDYRTRYGEDKLKADFSEPLYKIVNKTLGASHGGRGGWKIGEWWIVGDGKDPYEDTVIQSCMNGLHLVTADQISHWIRDTNHRLFEVEIAGPVLDAGDKMVVAAARLVREVVVDDVLFALLKPRNEDWQVRREAENIVGSQLLHDMAKARLQKVIDGGSFPDGTFDELADALRPDTDARDGRLPEKARDVLRRMEVKRRLLGAQRTLINARIEYAQVMGEPTDDLYKELKALDDERKRQSRLYGVLRLSSTTTYSDWMYSRSYDRQRSLRHEFDRAVGAWVATNKAALTKGITLADALARTKGEATKQKRGV